MSVVQVKDFMVHMVVGAGILLMLSACQTAKHTEVVGSSELPQEPVMDEPSFDGTDMFPKEEIDVVDTMGEMEDDRLEGVTFDELVEDRGYEDVTEPDMEKDGASVELSPVFFDFDKYAIRQDMTGVLRENVDMLKNKYQEASVLIEGHCDERGTVEYNIELGKRRAQAVKDALIDMGVRESRISIVSYGKEKPFCMASDPSCWAQNRRGHILLQDMR